MKKNKYYTLTSLRNYLNSNFKKKTGKDFTTSDVQSYIKRGKLPEYLLIDGKEVNVEPANLNGVEGSKLYELKID